MLDHNKPENSLWNIVFNIIIPILILNKLSRFIGPLAALILALGFPFVYGLLDYLRKKKANFFSILGLVNVSITGTLALLGLGGIWFSVKEAAFPLLIGLFVFLSASSKAPFIQTLFLNPQLIKMDLLWKILGEKQNESAFEQHLRFCTKLLSLSFLMSATINFFLAQRIFLPLDSALDATAQSIQLNEQIAEMTKWAMIVTMIPSMVMLVGIFLYLLKGIEKLTGLKSEEILNQ